MMKMCWNKTKTHKCILLWILSGIHVSIQHSTRSAYCLPYTVLGSSHLPNKDALRGMLVNVLSWMRVGVWRQAYEEGIGLLWLVGLLVQVLQNQGCSKLLALSYQVQLGFPPVKSGVVPQRKQIGSEIPGASHWICSGVLILLHAPGVLARTPVAELSICSVRLVYVSALFLEHELHESRGYFPLCVAYPIPHMLLHM